LQRALAVKPADTFLDVDNIADENLMVSVCAGILIVRRESNTFATTQKYVELKAPDSFPPPQKHNEIF
jgi:hypothetical protein